MYRVVQIAKSISLKVYVDTLGNPDVHKRNLTAQFPGIQFTVCSKADSIYPIVSAASIVAKVPSFPFSKH